MMKFAKYIKKFSVHRKLIASQHIDKTSQKNMKHGFHKSKLIKQYQKMDSLLNSFTIFHSYKNQSIVCISI